jgi:hypothetical protein
MRRLAFSIAAALSLLLCAILAGLWVRSQHTFTRLTCTSPLDDPAQVKQRRVMLLMWGDAFEVWVATEVFHPEDAAARASLIRDLPRTGRTEVFERDGWSTAAGGAADAADHWDFWYRSPEESRRARADVSFTLPVGGSEYRVTTESERAFFVPWWFLALVSALLPASACFKWIRGRARVRAGGCRTCGYSLTGNTSGVCPECATPTIAGVKA